MTPPDAPEVPHATAPDGSQHRLPTETEVEGSLAELRARAEVWRKNGASVVVVQGLGFVGSAMAAVAAAARTPDGLPRHFVIGVDLPTEAAYWKVARLKAALPPFPSPDPELPALIHEAVLETRNLTATAAEAAYGFADVVVVDVPLDVEDRACFEPASLRLDPSGFEAAIQAIGRHLRPEALVLVETTVPVGTLERCVRPLLGQAFAQRGLTGEPRVAHAYERVMPGPRYVDSIRRFWRSFSALDEPSGQQARRFLEGITDTARFPLWELSDPSASELAKLLENSYRAANIAFIHEWTLMAEELGINLFEVVESIRVRQGTHDNLRYPGFGVGGYCLTKDSLLAQWSLTHRYGSGHRLGMTLEALRINFEMPLHTLDLLRRLLGSLQGRCVALLGVSYLAEVPDTRNTPAEQLVDALGSEGAELRLHDPVTRSWAERPQHSIEEDLSAVLAEAEAVVLAVPHRAYLALGVDQWRRALRPGAVLVDAQNLLDDDTAMALHQQGHRLLGVGKGHWRKLGLDR